MITYMTNERKFNIEDELFNTLKYKIIKHLITKGSLKNIRDITNKTEIYVINNEIKELEKQKIKIMLINKYWIF